MQSTIFKSAMNNGLLLGLLFSLNSFFAFSRYGNLTLVSDIVFILIIVTTYHTTKKYRDKYCNGTISFAKSHNFIVYSFFFGSLISTITKYIYFKYIDTSFLSDVIYNQSIQNFKTIGKTLTEEEIELFKAFMNNTFSFCIQFIWINLFFGTILGLILSFFIKRKESDQSGQVKNIEV